MKRLLVLLLATLCMTGCGNKKTVTHEDVIVDKQTRQELDNLATWWWDIPMTKTNYYFTLEQYGEMSVDKNVYNKYNIGDTYTWEETVYDT